MEFVRLDSDTYLPDLLLNEFESLVWTERLYTPGDFKLVTANIDEVREQFPEDTLVSHLDTAHVAMVEDHLIEINEDGIQTLTITGRTLDNFLEHRGVATAITSTPDAEWFSEADHPLFWVRNRMNEHVQSGILSPYDIVPGAVASSLDAPDELYAARARIESLRAVIDPILKQFGMGIKVTRDAANPLITGMLQFWCYVGVDRTANQEDVTPVIWDVTAGDFETESYFFSNRDYKNVAYVFSPMGAQIVTLAIDGHGTGGDVSYYSGLDRRVLVIDASDITTETLEVSHIKQLYQRGGQELAKHRKIKLFNGRVSPNIKEQYGVDYNLGDFVTVNGKYDMTQTMMVTEYIRTHDAASGDSGYPTLTAVE